MRPDNYVLYSAIVPLIRGNWSVPVMAKLWLWLTYHLEYDIECIVMSEVEDRDRNRDGNCGKQKGRGGYCWDDQITIKGNKHSSNTNNHHRNYTA